MPAPAPTLPGDEKEDKLNASHKDYEAKFGGDAYVSAGLDQLEAHANDPSNATDDKSLDEAEADSPWQYKGTGAGGAANAAKKLGFKGLLKKRGAIGLIIALVTGGGIAITVPPMFLGQGINSQLYSMFSSSTGFLGAADDNMFRIRLFGGTTITSNCTIARINCKFAGITTAEMDLLKAGGVTFSPEAGKPVPGIDDKFTFDSFMVNGETVNATNFHSKMRNPLLANKLKPIKKTALWNAQRNIERLKTKRLLGITENPDTKASSSDELKEKVYAETETGKGTPIIPKVADIAEGTDPDVATNTTNVNSGVNTGSTDLSDKVAAAKAAAAEGDFSTIKDLPNGNVTESLLREGASLEDMRSPWQAGWSWINSVDAADTVCTVYQLGNTAVTISRTIVLMNIIRYGYIFISTFDKMKAGDATPEDTNQLMSVLTSQNKFGQSFDSSPTMQYLFTGKLATDTPMSISAQGGETLQQVSTLMTSINTLAGLGSTAGGKAFLTTTCGVATNLAFQIGAVVIDAAVTIAASIFTGGGYAALRVTGQVAAKSAMKGAMTLVKDTVVKEFKEQFIDVAKNMFKRNVSKEVRSEARQKTLRLIRTQATDVWNIAGIMLLLVENFGFDYIIQALAGTDVLGYMDDSLQTADAIVTARDSEDYMSAISTGGVVQTIDQASAYRQENDIYIAQSIQSERDDANPLDINNPYSTLGSFMSNFSTKVASMYNSSSLVSTLGGVLQAPALAMSSLSTSLNVSASDKATVQEISDYAADPYMQNRNLCVSIAKNPCAGGDLNYIRNTPADEVLSQAINSGYITASGSIKKGTSSRPNPYEDHVKNCNSAFKSYLDADLLDESIVQPEYCRVEDRRYFNLLTSLRSLLIEEADQSVTEGDLVLPVDEGYSPRDSDSDFGPRSCGGCSAWHRGIDMGNFPDGTLGKPVYAIADGEVIMSGINGQGSTAQPCRGEGTGPNNTVRIRHANGMISEYMHMGGQEITVNVGDTVTAGQQIGRINNCGQSYGAHLHFALLKFEVNADQYPDIAAIESDGSGEQAIDPVLYYALFGLQI